MRVLVIGAGFIGTHVTQRLLELGHEVTVMDRRRERDRFFGTKVRLFLGDVRDQGAVSEALLDQEGVINLAGILGTMETIDNPRPSVETNILGALNVFEACRPNRINPTGIKGVQIGVGNHYMNNTYAITKTAAERLALMFNKEHGTKIAAVRGLNAYGPYQKAKPVKKLVPNLVLRALKGDPLEIFGDGEQVMDMIYVKDLAEVLIRALTEEHNEYQSILEAGTGRRTSVNQIAHLVNDISGNTAGIRHLPMRPGEPDRSIVLGEPSTLIPLGITEKDLTSLESGLERTVAWYREHFSKD